MNKPSIRSQGGQLIVEAVLIIVMMMGITMLTANYFKNSEVLKQLITGPWAHLSGMLQNGVWAPPGAGALSHPNGHERHVVITGEEAR